MATVINADHWRLAPHLELIDRTIRDLVLRRIPERVVVVRLPPRHGKSELLSHYTPAWFMARFPKRNCLLVSYEADFAASWGRKARDTFVEVVDEYPEYFATSLNKNQASAKNWATTDGGYMATSGVDGPITGKGFHLGIVDDLIKNSEEAHSEVYRRKTWEWFTSTLWSRKEPNGVMVVIGTPWHRDDYLARLRNWDEPIHEICLPAICESDSDVIGRVKGDALWPERFPADELERIRRAQGPYYWRALYQQEPSQHEQAEWPESFFADVLVDCRPDIDERQFTVLALDPSIGKTEKSDYSAFVAIDVLRDGSMVVSSDIQRREITQMVDDGLDHCTTFEPMVWAVEINGFASLKPLIHNMAGDRTIPLATVTQHRNKPARIRLGVGPSLRQKRLKFIRSKSTTLLLEQMRDFPLGKYDDGPDVLEMGIRVAQAILAGEHNEQPLAKRILA